MKTGIQLIAEERQEQIEKHGKTVLSDVKNNSESQLLEAMIMVTSNVAFQRSGIIDMPSDTFEDLRVSDWSRGLCRHILSKPQIEQLAIIGAFAAAEIDRLQYAATTPAAPSAE